MKALLHQFFRFALVGLSAFALEFAMFFLLDELFVPALFHHLPEKSGTLISTGVAFTIATIYNYICSMKWVFAPRTDASGRRIFTIFVCLSVIAFGLNEVLMHFLLDVFAFLPLGKYVAKVVATFLVTLYNFVSRKLFLEEHAHSGHSQHSHSRR